MAIPKLIIELRKRLDLNKASAATLPSWPLPKTQLSGTRTFSNEIDCVVVARQPNVWCRSPNLTPAVLESTKNIVVERPASL